MGRIGFINDQSQRHIFIKGTEATGVALILDFFGSLFIYFFPALFLEEAVHVACCLSVLHFRCFIRGTRLNSLVFTPAQLCKCSLRAEGSGMLWIPKREDSSAGLCLFLGSGNACGSKREEDSKREASTPGFLFTTSGSNRRNPVRILFVIYQWHESCTKCVVNGGTAVNIFKTYILPPVTCTHIKSTTIQLN